MGQLARARPGGLAAILCALDARVRPARRDPQPDHRGGHRLALPKRAQARAEGLSRPSATQPQSALMRHPTRKRCRAAQDGGAGSPRLCHAAECERTRGRQGMSIAAVQADHYRIPLLVALSDSTHGTMEAFELITVRVRDADGAEGLGYTYTVGAGGGAIHDLIARDLGPALAGADETRIEALWQRLWWQVHYVGRGGLAVHAISAIDSALWDLMAR